MPNPTIRLLETPAEIEQTEQLQRLVWPGSDLDGILRHVLISGARNGGVVAVKGSGAGEISPAPDPF